MFENRPARLILCPCLGSLGGDKVFLFLLFNIHLFLFFIVLLKIACLRVVIYFYSGLFLFILNPIIPVFIIDVLGSSFILVKFIFLRLVDDGFSIKKQLFLMFNM